MGLCQLKQALSQKVMLYEQQLLPLLQSPAQLGFAWVVAEVTGSEHSHRKGSLSPLSGAQ